MSEDDFELVPITPVRKLEREIMSLKAQMKSSPDQTTLVNQIVEILRMNQAIVDQLSTKQGELINKINETNSKLDKLSESINSLVQELIAGAEEEVGSSQQQAGPSDDRLERIMEQNNALLNSLSVIAKEMQKAGGEK